MESMRIRADLQHGYVSSDPWSPSLDGILAYVVMRERLGDEAFVTSAARTMALRPVEGLPLEVVSYGELWWYAASSPRVIGKAAVRQAFFHRRFDDQHEQFLADKVGKVLTAAGPYKASRLADMHVICGGLEWSAVGDRREIERLLARVTAIGGARSRGYGSVARWSVEPAGPESRLSAHRQRPLPVVYADKHGVTGAVMSWHLVPPARAPASRADCVMPDAAA